MAEAARGTAPRAPSANQASAPSALEGLGDGGVDALVLAAGRSSSLLRRTRRSARPRRAGGTPPSRAGSRSCRRCGSRPAAGTHFSRVDRRRCAASCAQACRARRFAPSRPEVREGDRLVHGDEPLRRVAEDHRLLRAPGMRILVLQPAAGHERAGLDQRLDHRLVGVALLALVGDDALPAKPRRLLGVRRTVRRRRCRGSPCRCRSAASVCAMLDVQMSKSSRPWPGAVCTNPVPASSVT